MQLNSVAVSTDSSIGGYTVKLRQLLFRLWHLSAVRPECLNNSLKLPVEFASVGLPLSEVNRHAIAQLLTIPFLPLVSLNLGWPNSAIEASRLRMTNFTPKHSPKTTTLKRGFGVLDLTPNSSICC